MTEQAKAADAARRAYVYSGTWTAVADAVLAVGGQGDGRAVELLRYALHLRMHGERAPGGTETWAQFDQDAENFLRSLS